MHYLKRAITLLLLPVCFSITLPAQNFIFAQLTGTPVNTAGWNFQGAARVANITATNNTEILLCPVSSGSSGAVFYNQPINLSLCSRWKAEFDLRMFDGNGADGIAFCFLDVPPSGFVSGGGLGIPSTANGLKVCFDTWNNCVPFGAASSHVNVPKIELRWGAGYNECTQQPTKDNADNGLSFLNGADYSHAKITYDNGNISVYVNDSLYLTGFQQFNFPGYLGFTASTGGSNDNHSIKNVVIYTEMPPSEAGSSASVCPNNPVQLGRMDNVEYVYSWSPSTGLNATDIANPSVHIDNITAAAESHIYHVKTAFKTNPGCASTDSVIVKVLPRPTVNFLTPDICLNDAKAIFADSSYTLEPGLLPFTYQWNFGDPNATAANPNIAVGANPSHHYSAAADYNVKLAVKNNAGCADSLVKVFTVNGAVPVSDFMIDNTVALCSNSAIKIRDKSGVDFGNITKVIISWGDSSGVSYTDEAPFPGKVYDHFYPAGQALPVTAYSILYTAYSGISCLDAGAKQANILKSPKVIFAAIPSLCENDAPVKITQASETTGLPGFFEYSGKGVGSDGLLTPQEAGNGTSQLMAKYSSTNDCEDSAYQQLIIYPLPTVTAGPDTYVLEGGHIIINAIASGSDLTFNWSPATYLNDYTILNPVTTPPKDIQYALKVTGVGGCQASDSVTIIVLKNPFIPNVFSPNGDGINDNWQIRYLNTYPGCTVDVFDRYGLQVYHSSGYEKPWNGSDKGKPLPVGIYYYIINTKKHERLFTGSVMILR